MMMMHNDYCLITGFLSLRICDLCCFLFKDGISDNKVKFGRKKPHFTAYYIMLYGRTYASKFFLNNNN